MTHEPQLLDEPDEDDMDRRTFFDRMSTAAMAGGLCAGYGMLAAMAGQFLYPAGADPKAWVFVADIKRFRKGEALPFRAPNNQALVITRLGDAGTAADFVALSSICPHLGCVVYWEAQNDRFFCPCHNGVFDKQGNAKEGPPEKAGQSLTKFELRLEGDLLFVQVPLELPSVG